MKRKALAVGLLAVIASHAYAEGLPVESGLWEMTTTINMPMLPAPQTTTMTECVEDDLLDVGDMSGGDMDTDCTFNVEQTGANAMKWSMECPMEGGTTRAEWQASSSGGTVEGSGKVTVEAMGQTMEMTSTFSGKHLGPCN